MALHTESASPTQHPQAERAAGNTEALDPRKRVHPRDPRKRPASNSPEPGRPDKQQKANEPLSPSGKTGSRKSSLSVSNGPSYTTQTAPGNVGRPSSHLVSDLQKSGDGAMRSPASPYNGSGSGISTPQRANAAPVSSMNTFETSDIADDGPSIFAALQSFGVQVAAQASLHVAHRHATEAHRRACEEYEAQRRSFDRFPTLKEQKNQARVRTDKALKEAKKDLERQEIAQMQTMEKLASVIGQTTNAKPERDALRTDLVSREELDMLTKDHDSLRKDYNDLRSFMNATQTKIAKTEESVEDARRVADGAADSAASSVEVASQANKNFDDNRKAIVEAARNASDAKTAATHNSKVVEKAAAQANGAIKAALEAKSVVDAVPQCQSDILRCQNGLRDCLNQLAISQNDTRRPSEMKAPNSDSRDENPKRQEGLAGDVILDIKACQEELKSLKKGFVDVETKYETLTQELAGVRRGQTGLTKDVEQLKTTDLRQGTTAQDTRDTIDMDQEYRSRVDKIWTHKIWEDGPKLVETVGNVDRSIAQLEQALQEVRDNFATFTDEINEAGKGTVKQRFKKLDQFVNNLSSQLPGDDKMTILQRINAIEEKLEDASKKRSIISTSDLINVAPSQSSLEDGEIISQQTESYNSVHQDLLNARVSELEQKAAAIRTQLEEVKRGIRVDSPSGHVTADASTVSRLSDVEKELRSIQEQEEERDALMLEAVDERIASLKAKLESAAQRDRDGSSGQEKCLRDFAAELERINASVENRVTQDAFQRWAATNVRATQDDLTRMSAQVKELQAQKNRPTSASAPQGPGGGAPSPQMPNGVNSPYINNNNHHRVSTPLASAAAGPDTSRLQSQIERVQAQVDAIVMPLQHLKQRCDNLVTDEVVKAMADQFSLMYPDAKNFNSATKALSSSIKNAEHELRVLKQSNSNVRLDNVESVVKQHSGKLDNVQWKYDKLQEELAEQAKRVSKARVQIRNIRIRVDPEDRDED